MKSSATVPRQGQGGIARARPGLWVAHDVAKPQGRITERLELTDQVGSDRSNAGQGSVRGDESERIAGLPLGDSRNLPALGQAVALERQLIDPVDYEAIPCIEVRRAPITADIPAVLNHNSLRTEGVIVNRMGIGVGRVELQTP